MAEKSEDVKAGTVTAPTIRWDYAKMRSSYANVVNAASTREEVTLLFGTNQAWHSGLKEVVVELTDRIILNPHAAKRLLMLLGKLVEEYEANYGELRIEAEKKGTVRKA